MGKNSSSSRATERIGGPTDLPWGIIHRSKLEILCAILEGRGASRRISISASTARTVLFGEKSNSLDDHHRHSATAHPPAPFQFRSVPETRSGIIGNNTDAGAIVKNLLLKPLKIAQVTRSRHRSRLCKCALEVRFLLQYSGPRLYSLVDALLEAPRSQGEKRCARS